MIEKWNNIGAFLTRMNTYSEENKERIKLLAQETRLRYDAMEWGVSPQYLIVKEGLAYEEYNLNDESFLKKITNKIKEITKVIKAAIIIKEQVVLIDTDLHHAKKPFGQSHELGHYIIPEHKEILYVCSEADLNPLVRLEMEYEANIFASELLFPSPLMDSIYYNFPLSMETIIYLSKISSASIHSSAIRYVSACKGECCLLVLEKAQDDDENDGLTLTKQIPSPAWWNKYNKLLEDYQFFPACHNLSLIVFSGQSDDIIKNSVTVGDSHRFQVHTFYNRYIVLALLFIEQ